MRIYMKIFIELYFYSRFSGIDGIFEFLQTWWCLRFTVGGCLADLKPVEAVLVTAVGVGDSVGTAEQLQAVVVAGLTVRTAPQG